MRRILVEGRQANTSTYYVHTGDLSWWLFYTFPEDDLFPHIYLWEDETGQVVGWSLLSDIENAFDVFLHPALLDTPAYAQAFAWTAQQMEQRMLAAGENFVQKYWNWDCDTRNAALLADLGFAPYKDDVDMYFPLVDRLPAVQLPPGFSARLCRGESEVETRARAQYAAFESEAEWDKYVARFVRLMRSQAYLAARDWVIEAPDGRIAAFALTWHDPVNKVGKFEPVGTHPDFQKLGLGKAVMLSGLHDMQRAGLLAGQVNTSASHAPAVRLYQATGFSCDHLLKVYKKELAR
jgi:GNAT superfamily N-acetyltransferase